MAGPLDCVLTTMIEGQEIAPNVWVLQNQDTTRNIGVIVGTTGPYTGTPVDITAVDPGDLPIELDALARFADDMDGRLAALVFTATSSSHPALERWPDVHAVSPLGSTTSLPLSGWEVKSLSPGRLGVYGGKARILFCGELLVADTVPNLTSGADNYLEALEQIEALNLVLAVPLRGPVAKGKKAIKERIDADRAYTQNLVRHVVTSKAARIPLERVLHVANEVYEEYPFLEAHLHNLDSVWHELSR